VYEPYTYAFSKYINPNQTKDMIINDPIRTMSELVLKFWYIYDLETRVKEFAKAAEEYKVDGIVLHNNMSCRPNTCTFYDLKRRLQEDYDMPCLIIDSDQNDVRKFNETQVTNKIESFIEILTKRKKS